MDVFLFSRRCDMELATNEKTRTEKTERTETLSAEIDEPVGGRYAATLQPYGFPLDFIWGICFFLYREVVFL